MLTGDEGPDLAITRGLAQFFLQLVAQRAARPARSVAVNQLHRCASLLPRNVQFVLQPQPRLFYPWHSLFQVDQFDCNRLARHAFYVSSAPYTLAGGCNLLPGRLVSERKGLRIAVVYVCLRSFNIKDCHEHEIHRRLGPEYRNAARSRLC
jgi:hypothetical protein